MAQAARQQVMQDWRQAWRDFDEARRDLDALHELSRRRDISVAQLAEAESEIIPRLHAAMAEITRLTS